mmetsp:Transcript_15357/g.50218  ORF Transcript_15357/g.50218 Transcript_15357/m.50218 type:complete len:230 (+) Transcript_15357:314-1003(+)
MYQPPCVFLLVKSVSVSRSGAGAYAYTKASGALDLKRNEALRELVAEEETRLESFQPEQQGQRKKKTTTTLDVLAGAAATTKTVNRLRILARAAHEAQQDDEPVILAAATRPLAKKRGRPRGSTTTTANHGRGPKHLKRILPATAASLPAEKKSASSVAAAKEYIERMQHVHKVDTKIIVSFARRGVLSLEQHAVSLSVSQSVSQSREKFIHSATVVRSLLFTCLSDCF